MNWYEDFFSGVALELWRKVVTPEQTQKEVDFLERTLGVVVGSHLLDVPCGNGRHCLELAARGYQLTGMDISEEFLREAQQRAIETGLQVEWLHRNMRDLAGQSEYDGAYCMGNSFGYLQHEDTLTFLCALSLALKPGAKFVIEAGMAAESILPTLKERMWFPVQDMWLLIRNNYLPTESQLETEYTFIKEGRIETRRSFQYVYTVAEICRMLESYGLITSAMYSSPDQDPFQLGSQRLFLAAQKKT